MSFDGQGGQDPRELTCGLIARYVYLALSEMQEQTKAIGVEPWIPIETLKSPLVLTVDQLLPPDFEITAEILVAAGASTTIVQRFIHRKAIAEKQKQADARGAYDKIKADAASSTTSSPPSPSSPPTPPATPQPPAKEPTALIGEPEAPPKHPPCPTHNRLVVRGCPTCPQDEFLMLDDLAQRKPGTEYRELV